MRKLFDLPVRNEFTDKSYNLSSFLIVDEFTNDEAKISDVLKSRSNQWICQRLDTDHIQLTQWYDLADDLFKLWFKNQDVI